MHAPRSLVSSLRKTKIIDKQKINNCLLCSVLTALSSLPLSGGTETVARQNCQSDTHSGRGYDCFINTQRFTHYPVSTTTRHSISQSRKPPVQLVSWLVTCVRTLNYFVGCGRGCTGNELQKQCLHCAF